MKIVLGSAEFDCKQITVSYNFTDTGFDKSLVADLADPFLSDMEYYDALNLATTVKVTYPSGIKTYEYFCDSTRRNNAYINHQFLPTGDSISMYIPII